MARLKHLETNACPFANVPGENNARNGRFPPPDEMKNAVWLRPELFV